MTDAELNAYIKRAEKLLGDMPRHTGGTLRLDAFRVSDVMHELVRQIDAEAVVDG